METPLNLIIKLFTLCEKREYCNISFSGELVFSSENSALIQSCNSINEANGRFDELLLDGKEIDDKSEFPETGKVFKVTWRLAGQGRCQFYESFESYIDRTPSLGKGILEPYYVIEDPDKTESYEENKRKISRICEAITILSELAQYHDEKENSRNYQLVFVQAIDAAKVSTMVLPTFVSARMLTYEIIDNTLLQELKASLSLPDLHASEKQGIFRTTLSEIVSVDYEDLQPFEYLVKHWHDLLTRYKTNLDTYLSGFTFSKIKREVAEAELNLAEQHSKVISAITGKLFGIPISLVASFGVIGSTSVLSAIVFVLGALFVSIIIAGTIKNQQHQLKRIDCSRNILFGSLKDRQDSFPADLKKVFNKSVKQLEINFVFLKRLLWGFRILGWIPVLLATAIITFMYDVQISIC